MRPKINTHCQHCGKYIRPNSPYRAVYAGYEEDLICRECSQFFHDETLPRRHKPIANGTQSQSEPLSEPDPCEDVPLVHIGFHNARWYIAEGHVWSPIQDECANQSDPVIVALYLISHANGKINVAW